MLFRKKFRGRSPDRDEEIDRARALRVAELLDTVRREIESERDGLRQRYERAGVEVALCLGALEGEPSKSAEKRLKGLEEAMIYCEQRTARLDEQLGLYRSLTESVRPA